MNAIPNERAHEPTNVQTDSSLKWMLLMVLGVIIIAALYFLVVKCMPNPGEFGDMFGGLNALFAGFAFSGVIISIRMQAKELALQREELADTRDVLKLQNKAMEDQVHESRAKSSLDQFFVLVKFAQNQEERLKPDIYNERTGWQATANKIRSAQANNNLQPSKHADALLNGKLIHNQFNFIQYLGTINYVIKFFNKNRGVFQNDKEVFVTFLPNDFFKTISKYKILEYDGLKQLTNLSDEVEAYTTEKSET